MRREAWVFVAAPLTARSARFAVAGLAEPGTAVSDRGYTNPLSSLVAAPLTARSARFAVAGLAEPGTAVNDHSYTKSLSALVAAPVTARSARFAVAGLAEPGTAVSDHGYTKPGSTRLRRLGHELAPTFGLPLAAQFSALRATRST